MLLHFAWRLFYNEFACMFDFVSGCISLGKWKAWCHTSIYYLQHKRVLELGHGPGHLLIALKTAGYQPFGIDLSPRMGRQAMWKLRCARLEVPLVRCRAQALPFRSGSFDGAVATFPTDYILDLNTLREVARVMSERGRLVVVAGAQRKGPQPNPHFIDWLHRITGQDGTEPGGHKSIFDQAGMLARIEHQSVGDGTVILIVAEKRKQDSTSATMRIEQGHRNLAHYERSHVEERVPMEAGHREEVAVDVIEECRETH